jgi:signal peptidase II
MHRLTFKPWLWAPLVLVVDFVSKRLVLANEATLRAKVQIIGDLLRFIYVRNPGSAMGLFPVGRVVLVSVSFAASVFLVYLYRTTDKELAIRRGAMAAILGGALGNLIDRVFYGGLVVDFIDVGIGTHRFYTFNVADMGVTVGGALLFLCILLEGRIRKPEPLAAPTEPVTGEQLDHE